MTIDKSSAQFFERKYCAKADPWEFEDSPYELSRYSAVIASLEGRFFPNAFEPGCSIGVLTERLAKQCGHLEAIDFSPTAVATARVRCRALNNVVIRTESLADWDDNRFYDLVMLSEIGYYFSEAALGALATRLLAHLKPSGLLVGCHWLGYSQDHILSGDRVHEVVNSTPGLNNCWSKRYPQFRIDHWSKS